MSTPTTVRRAQEIGVAAALRPGLAYRRAALPAGYRPPLATSDPRAGKEGGHRPRPGAGRRLLVMYRFGTPLRGSSYRWRTASGAQLVT